MTGMIKKDLLMIKNNYKSIIITFVLFVFYSIMFDMNMSFFLPFMGLMICISTITYDEYYNWHTYASSLPQGKVNVVKSKYITTLLITILLAILSFAISLIIVNTKGSVVTEEALSTIMGELLALIFMMSVLFPLLFKFDVEKGRIAMMIIGIGAFGIILLLKEFVKIDISPEFIKFLESNMVLIFIGLSILLVTISYFISKKVYLKREF